jgi:hypothetical protein
MTTTDTQRGADGAGMIGACRMVTTGRRNWVRAIGDMILFVENAGGNVTEIHVGELQYREMTDGTLDYVSRDDLGPDTLYERPMRLIESPSYIGVVIEGQE